MAVVGAHGNGRELMLLSIDTEKNTEGDRGGECWKSEMRGKVGPSDGPIYITSGVARVISLRMRLCDGHDLPPIVFALSSIRDCVVL